MGTGSKVALVLLRISELICSTIVLGILGSFVHQVNRAGVGITPASSIPSSSHPSARRTLSSSSSPSSIHSWASPFDFILFVLWLVVFCLGETAEKPLAPACECKG